MFRFFTVYGPWGRPDMASFKFTDAILDGRPLDVCDERRMARDFTYVDDLVEVVVRLVDTVPNEAGRVVATGVVNTLSHVAPHRVSTLRAGPRSIYWISSAPSNAAPGCARR